MKYSITAAAAPETIGPYSQGTTAGRLVFTSGQLPIDPDDPHSLVEGGMREQAERILEITSILLSEAGCMLSDVAKTTVYLVNFEDLDAFDEVYERYFTTPFPARSIVKISELPLGSLVEMDCIACR